MHRGPRGAVLELSESVRLQQVSDYDAFAVLIGPDGTVRWATPISTPGYDVAKRALVLASHKIGLKCAFVRRGL